MSAGLEKMRELENALAEDFTREQPRVKILREHIVRDFFGKNTTFYKYEFESNVVEPGWYDEFLRYQKEFSAMNFHYQQFLKRARSAMLKYRDGTEI